MKTAPAFRCSRREVEHVRLPVERHGRPPRPAVPLRVVVEREPPAAAVGREHLAGLPHALPVRRRHLGREVVAHRRAVGDGDAHRVGDGREGVRPGRVERLDLVVAVEVAEVRGRVGHAVDEADRARERDRVVERELAHVVAVVRAERVGRLGPPEQAADLARLLARPVRLRPAVAVHRRGSSARCTATRCSAPPSAGPATGRASGR